MIKEERPSESFTYTYDNLGNLSKISYTSGSTTTNYYVVCNSRKDVEAIYDTSGVLQARYIYDAWGNSKVVDASNNEITSTSHIGNINPIRYRGYYYDKETNLYYLLSRYYDADTCRFISSDSVGYIEPDSVNGLNLYAYCGNNPINRIDLDGFFWIDIEKCFFNTWYKIKAFIINTFGIEISTVSSLDISHKIIQEPSPIVVETGTIMTEIVSQKGNSSKPISIYAESNLTKPLKSSVIGTKINVSNLSLEATVGLDNIGVFGSLVNKNKVNSFGIKASLAEFKVGFEYSETIQWENSKQTNYTNISVSGWWIYAIYAIYTSGHSALQPNY